MRVNKTIFLASLTLFLTACGGGSSSSDTTSLNNGAGGTDANVVTPVTCNKGIPTGLSKINDAGMFTEALYKFENDNPVYEIMIQNQNTNTQYLNLYTYTLSNNIFYENVTTLDLPDTDPSAFYENFFQYALNDNGLFTSNDAVRTSLGWPLKYVKSVENTSLTFSNFNDQCNLAVASSQMAYNKVDVSGQPISIILERDPNVTYIGYKYLPNSFGYYLDTTSAYMPSDKKIAAYNALRNTTAVFPEGSYIYLLKQYTSSDDTIFFDDKSVSDSTTLQDWAAQTYISLNQSVWKLDQIAGYNVIYAINPDGSHYEKYVDPAVQKDGKIYDAEWQFKGSQIDSHSQGEDSLMNQTAKDAILAQIQNYFN